MLNKIVLMGRLTRDPELRRTDSGIAVASFSLACDRDYSGKDGAEKQTDFVDIVAWRHTAEFVGKYFAKGRMAVVSGRLQIRPWTDKEGNKRRSAEIVAESVLATANATGTASNPVSSSPRRPVIRMPPAMIPHMSRISPKLKTMIPIFRSEVDSHGRKENVHEIHHR